MNKPRNSHGLWNSGLLPCMALSLFLVSGCATSEPARQARPFNKIDPYENVNREIYKFNDMVDDYIAGPISDAYRYITPKFVQTGVANAFANIKNINVVFNDFLQAKFVQGAEDTGRFAINSTLGLAGLFDVAKSLSLEQHQEDFDQTLAVWGISKGPYLVVPFLGPSTVRGIPGAAFDTAVNPTSYVATPFQALSMLNARANAEGALRFIDEAALDPYVFTRESFLQWRDNLATDGKSNANTALDEESLDADLADATPRATKGGFLTMDKFGFGKVSDTFVLVRDSFDQTTLAFEQANSKLDRLKLDHSKLLMLPTHYKVH